MTLSARLAAVVEALPLRAGMRVIEIGCGPGAAARAVAERVGPTGFVLAVDRSPRAIDQVERGCADLLAAGRLAPRLCAAEDLGLEPGEAPYDLAFAVRVGALDGRHPEQGRRALASVAGMLTDAGHLYIDGGAPLRQVALARRGDAG